MAASAFTFQFWGSGKRSRFTEIDVCFPCVWFLWFWWIKKIKFNQQYFVTFTVSVYLIYDFWWMKHWLLGGSDLAGTASRHINVSEGKKKCWLRKRIMFSLQFEKLKMLLVVRWLHNLGEKNVTWCCVIIWLHWVYIHFYCNIMLRDFSFFLSFTKSKLLQPI